MELKKKTTLSPQRACEEVKEKREAFIARQGTLRANDLVFLDESGMHPGMGPMRGWAPRGTRFFGPEQPYARGQRVSILGAMSMQGLLAADVIDGGMKSEDFLAFLRKLGPKLRPGQLVCMDNLQAHKSQKVKTLIRSYGAKPLYLPPYSPDLNPIEAAWAKIKHLARKRAAVCVDDLKAAIHHALSLVSQRDAHGWFNFCGYYPSLPF